MSLTTWYRPVLREDFFPQQPRGTGCAHAKWFFRTHDGVTTANPNPKHPDNQAKGRGDHKKPTTSAQSNLEAWCEERGLTIVSKQNPRGEYYTAMEAMYDATGGWARQW